MGDRSSPRLSWVIAGRLPWDGVWLNRHYVARELAREEPVVWVLDPRPANPLRRRGATGDRWGEIGGGAPHGVTTIRPPELPLQRFGLFRRLGERRAARKIRARIPDGGGAVLVLLPRARLLPPGALGEALTVYYCPDDFRELPDGTRDDAFCAWEDEALARADLVVGISESLCAALRERHDRVRLVENGFDPEIFRPEPGPEPGDVADLPRPRVGYVGSVRAPLIDAELVAAVAEGRPDWTFCLIGWHDADDPGVARLRNLPNVRVLGPRPREDLARYIAAMDVMTCPYPKCRVTERGSPLKAYEALAVGRPLVATNAPQLDALRPHLRSTEGTEGFVAALAQVLADPPEGGGRVAEGFTWARRAADFRGHVAGALVKSPSS